MTAPQTEFVPPPDWGPGLDYWVADGEMDPDIPWPENFEVCGVPDYDPSPLAQDPKRHGTSMMAWPMYDVTDPVKAIEIFCSVLEGMSAEALQHWYALPDRFLHIAAGDRSMDNSQLDTFGLQIPPELVRRIRQLRIRLQITLHPASKIVVSSGY